VSSEAYRRAGVDLDAAARAVELIRELGGGASRPELVEGVGGFAGLFEIGDGRFLAAATDGVGTKLEIARRAGRLDTVGIDLVAMCADDVVCTGAEPLFFLDYLAVGSVQPERVAAIVAGVAEGCRRAGCALLGGETAEHPGVMAPDAFDLAGFCVGVVEQERRLGPDLVQDGDVLIGLASSGLHANGFSLVRDALLERGGYALDAIVTPLRRPLVDELLEPTAIYAPLVLGLGREGLLHVAAHVTGGGIVENVPRVLPTGLEADVAWGSWPEPPVFELLRAETGASEDDLRATFNLGIGMVLVVPPDRADQVIALAEGSGSAAFPIGLVRA
jgi:phosphoribosylformylglycinamidine cyclo-ligase